MMMRDVRTLDPRMQRWVACTRVIATLLFTYQQVREYGSCHFCVRWLVMHLSVFSASTPIISPTKLTKGVKCLRSFNQALRYFLFFSLSRNFSRFLDW